jgi:hypothetical protein
MATCPKCGGYLGSHHRCRGHSRRLLREISLGVAGGIAGFVGGFLAGHPSDLLLIVTSLLGAVLTLAVHRYVRF